jgi:hypothetical protein
MHDVNRGPGLLCAGIRRTLGLLLSFSLCFAALPKNLSAMQDAPPATPAQSQQGPQYATKSPEQLQQLVAPIALYPDALVAQILVASTFPVEVVEADRWAQSHADLEGSALAEAIDREPWDPSVKALTAFPSVLGNMDKNLSWTATLGDAYYNQEQDVMAAVQVMRQNAEQAGNLETTQQQVVNTEQSTINVEPADPDIVYVPAYDPWIVYGHPIVAWPGWYHSAGIWYEGTYVWFGDGFKVGFFVEYGWGWSHWGCDWSHYYAKHDDKRYLSRTRTLYKGNALARSPRQR